MRNVKDFKAGETLTIHGLRANGTPHRMDLIIDGQPWKSDPGHMVKAHGINRAGTRGAAYVIDQMDDAAAVLRIRTWKSHPRTVLVEGFMGDGSELWGTILRREDVEAAAEAGAQQAPATLMAGQPLPTQAQIDMLVGIVQAGVLTISSTVALNADMTRTAIVTGLGEDHLGCTITVQWDATGTEEQVYADLVQRVKMRTREWDGHTVPENVLVTPWWNMNGKLFFCAWEAGVRFAVREPGGLWRYQRTVCDIAGVAFAECGELNQLSRAIRVRQ